MENDSLSRNRLSKARINETVLLQRVWDERPSDMLDSYLVQDVEDPRLNIQSILTRHFLIRELFNEDAYDHLMKHEIYFSLTANWLLGLMKSPDSRNNINSRMKAVLDLLRKGKPTAPTFLAEAFELPVFVNYIVDLLSWVPQEHNGQQIPGYLLDTFCTVWSQALARKTPRLISVIEPGCGSANDYRYLSAFGLAPFLQYTGFDLSRKNINNAASRYPSIDFKRGNIFDIPAAENTYEYCFVHDLLEHLSPEGMEQAIREMCRVTSKKICLHFFRMEESLQHQINKRGLDYLNQLSKSRTFDLFDGQAEHVEMIHIDTFLKEHFSYSGTHNKKAWTWIIDLKR